MESWTSFLPKEDFIWMHGQRIKLLRVAPKGMDPLWPCFIMCMTSFNVNGHMNTRGITDYQKRDIRGTDMQWMTTGVIPACCCHLVMLSMSFRKTSGSAGLSASINHFFKWNWRMETVTSFSWKQRAFQMIMKSCQLGVPCHDAVD